MQKNGASETTRLAYAGEKSTIPAWMKEYFHYKFLLLDVAGEGELWYLQLHLYTNVFFLLLFWVSSVLFPVGVGRKGLITCGDEFEIEELFDFWYNCLPRFLHSIITILNEEI